MLSQLLRVASEAGAFAGTVPDIGPTATTTNVRPVNAGYIDGRAHPEMGMGNQLDSFRGTLYAAVDKIARRTAQIPGRLVQMELENGEDPLETIIHLHPYVTLFSDMNGHKPHPEYSVWEIKYILQVSLDLTGEGWWLVERDSFGVPSKITPLPANRMTIVFDKTTGMVAGHFFSPKGTTPDNGGIFIPKREWKYLQDVKHLSEPFIAFFRYPSPRGIEDARGWSPVKAGAYAYDINLFEHIYKKNFLAQGAQLGGILQSEVALSPDQIKEYLDIFRERHGGPGKAGLPMVLPKMLKWETTEPSPRDMQWAEAVNLTNSEILQLYGISDAKLGRADIGNRNTADAMDVTFNREVIQSRLDIQTSKLNTEFIPVYPGQTDALFFTHRFDDPVPGDGELAMKRENQDLINGVRTPNEIRASRNDKHLGKFGKYGDQVYKPINMLPVDPSAATLEISQDDADKLGYIAPEDQAKLDADAAATQSKLDAKNNADQNKNDSNKNDSKKGDVKKSSGRSLHRDSDPVLEAIVSYLVSEKSHELWRLHIEGIVRASIADEVSIASMLVGDGTLSVDHDKIANDWVRGMHARIDLISNTTANAVRDSIEEVLANDGSIEQVIRAVTDVFNFGKRVRSLAIARTEVLGANGYAGIRTYEEAGIPFKRWITNIDGKERSTHADCHRQVVAINAKFRVGGADMDHPGDPTAPASEVVNCRCAAIPETDERSSIWDDERMQALWEGFDARTQSNEVLLAEAAQLVFQQQHATIVSILNRYA